MSVLDDILSRKAEEVASLRRDHSEASLLRAVRDADQPRGFRKALQQGEAPRVIAEFKRASPSKGEIRPGASPPEVVSRYQACGAAALSVLTDREFFAGALDDLRQARASTRLPVLRKDFTIDPIQLLEGRAAGADAALLIVAALEDNVLAELHSTGLEIGLDVLIEVHNRNELERALALEPELLGINNRDLKSFVTDVGTTRELLPLISGASGPLVVSESGLDDPAVVKALLADGVDAFLVGEALMREPDPGEALEHLRGTR